jgi:hypothetical protein
VSGFVVCSDVADSLDRAVAAIAARQHGVFTDRQADEIGLTADQRDFRVRTGRWRSLHPGVYVVAGVPDEWRARLLAACWSTRQTAVVSHRAAAALWDLPGGSREVVEITCRRDRRAQPPPHVIVHETDVLDPDDMTERDGIPIATVEQTLLGLAAVAPTVVEMAVDRALTRNLTTVARLVRFVERKRGRGRNGIGVLRGLVEARDPCAGVPESPMETKLRQLLRSHGLPEPVFQHVIRHDGAFVARVDAAYPDLRIAIEFDSYEHHTGRQALERDADRRNRLLRLQWTTITFTAADLRRDGGPALSALRAARTAAAHHLALQNRP